MLHLVNYITKPVLSSDRIGYFLLLLKLFIGNCKISAFTSEKNEWKRSLFKNENCFPSILITSYCEQSLHALIHVTCVSSSTVLKSQQYLTSNFILNPTKQKLPKVESSTKSQPASPGLKRHGALLGVISVLRVLGKAEQHRTWEVHLATRNCIFKCLVSSREKFCLPERTVNFLSLKCCLRS